jgi:sensory rhodopsin
VWFGIGAAIFAIGVVAFLGFALTRGDIRSPYYFLPPATAAIACVSYVVMTLVEVGIAPAALTVETVRYVDWALSTPFITYYLAMLAGTKLSTRAGAVGLNVAMIAFGYGATVAGGLLQWGLFAVSAVCFVGLLYLFLSTFTRAIRDAPQTSRNLFVSLRDLTALIWSVYPVAYLLGPGGFGAMGTADYSFVVVTLDVTAKVGFIGLMLARQYQLDTFVGAGARATPE